MEIRNCRTGAFVKIEGVLFAEEVGVNVGGLDFSIEQILGASAHGIVPNLAHHTIIADKG
jgi:hypothetical protein